MSIARLLLGVLFLWSSMVSLVEARGRPFGAGVILGEPTGISAKFWTTEMTAVDLGAAWSFAGKGAFHLHSDFLVHELNLVKDVKEIPGRLPIHFGVGGRLKFAHDVRVGIRIPIGVTFMFHNAPLDIFVEVAPIVDLAPATDPSVNGGIGARYFF